MGVAGFALELVRVLTKLGELTLQRIDLSVPAIGFSPCPVTLYPAAVQLGGDRRDGLGQRATHFVQLLAALLVRPRKIPCFGIGLVLGRTAMIATLAVTAPATRIRL
jgi:hypothetical protein